MDLKLNKDALTKGYRPEGAPQGGITMLNENSKLANLIFSEEGAEYATTRYSNWAAIVICGERKSSITCHHGVQKVEGTLLNADALYAIAVLPKADKNNAFFGLMLRLGKNDSESELLSIGRGGKERGFLYLVLQTQEGTLLTFTIAESENNTLYSFAEAYTDKGKRTFKNIINLIAFLTGDIAQTKMLQSFDDVMERR